MNRKTDPKFLRSIERGMLRSTFVSLFWAIFQHRKKASGLTLQTLAKAIPANKAEVSRWFNGDPNWTINTIASIADALDVELRVEARDRNTGIVFTSSGIQTKETQKRILKEPEATAEPAEIQLRSVRGAPPPIRTFAA